MKKIALFFCLFIVCNLFAQLESCPKVLILTCDNWVYEKSVGVDIEQKKVDFDYTKYKNGYLNSLDFKAQSPSMQKTILSELEYLKDYKVKKLPSLNLRFLLLPIFKKYKDVYIELSEMSCLNNEELLKNIAVEKDVQFVINISEIRITKGKSDRELELSVQLYDKLKDTIIFSTQAIGKTFKSAEYEGQGCDGSLECLITQATKEYALELRQKIAENNPIGLKKIATEKKRKEVWTETLQKDNYDKSFLPKVVAENNLSISADSSFYTIISEDQSMFVTLFLRKMNEEEEEQQRQGYFSDDCNCPKGKGYIISELNGFKYDGKWYFKDNQSMTCKAMAPDSAKIAYYKTLIKNNYFREDSIVFSEKYWEHGHFEREQSEVLRQAESIRLNKIMLNEAKTDEERKRCQDNIREYYQIDEQDKEFIGMFSLIVKQKEKERSERDRQFNLRFTKEIVQPFFLSRQKNNSNLHVDYSLGFDDKTLLIFPPDTSVILLPVIENGNTMKVYALIHEDGAKSYKFYKWTFFKDFLIPKEDYYGSPWKDFINLHTTWNMYYQFLNDTEFWNTKVLLKENGKYKFLE